MLARLYILMPYTLTVAEGEEFPIYEALDGGYTVRFLPPTRDPSMLFGPQPDGLTLNGRQAFLANVLRIDFQKEAFDRNSEAELDPPVEVIRRAVGDFHGRLRFAARAAHARPMSFPWVQWRLEYVNDDGTPLEPSAGHVRARGTIRVDFAFVALSRELWDIIFGLPGEFEVPVWDGLRLDAQDALPNVGTAVVLAATSLEVFISVLLDGLASLQGMRPELWTWIKERDGKFLQQPSVEEQFDVLLKLFCGHTLKEEPALWEAFKNLRSARNSFVHEGVARIGRSALTKDAATALVEHVNGIIQKVREWIPDSLQWPVFEPRVELRWTQMIIPPSSQAVPRTPGGAAGS